MALIRGLGTDPSDGGIVAGSLWIPNLKSNSISRIDLRRNRVVEKVGVGPFVVPDHPDELWVASFGGRDLWRLRPH